MAGAALGRTALGATTVGAGVTTARLAGARAGRAAVAVLEIMNPALKAQRMSERRISITELPCSDQIHLTLS